MAEHTKLPWEVLWQSRKSFSVGMKETQLVIAEVSIDHYDTSQANAAFIVQACNAHKDLVTTLQYVLEIIEDDDQPWWMDCPDKGGFDVDKIKATIEKARIE